MIDPIVVSAFNSSISSPADTTGTEEVGISPSHSLARALIVSSAIVGLRKAFGTLSHCREDPTASSVANSNARISPVQRIQKIKINLFRNS
mmetsp:Transcript_216/g.198  ORF Transcript_216/g.198 Transcript_216/m.198 type:complete len:91 (+) Transcript_216:259-531(+)